MAYVVDALIKAEKDPEKMAAEVNRQYLSDPHRATQAAMDAGIYYGAGPHVTAVINDMIEAGYITPAKRVG